ncbi:MAG: TIGR03546 family protein [Treponemataceae bacterium]
MLKKIFALIKSLNSNSKPGQIANSFCLGLLIGFLPKDNFFWYILVLFFAFVRVNKAGYWLMMLVGTLIAPAFDPFFDNLGYSILTWNVVEPFFAGIIEVPFLSFTRLNNSIVCGSFAFGILAYIPLFFAVFFFVKIWRKWITPKFRNSKLEKLFYKVPFIAKIIGKFVKVDS